LVRFVLAVQLTAQRRESEAQWRSLIDKVMRQVAPAHGGRVLDSSPSSMLLGFARAPLATQAAFDIRAAWQPTGSRQSVPLRMGMQLVELIADDAPLHGGEANLAARLSLLAGTNDIVGSDGVSAELKPLLVDDIETLWNCTLSR